MYALSHCEYKNYVTNIVKLLYRATRCKKTSETPSFTSKLSCRVLLVPRIKNHLSSFELGFLNIFSRHILLRSLSLLFVFVTELQIRREKKMTKKPRSIRLLRWFDFSQSENRKNNRKIFEGASVKPTACQNVSAYLKFSRPRLTIGYGKVPPLRKSFFQNNQFHFLYDDIFHKMRFLHVNI